MISSLQNNSQNNLFAKGRQTTFGFLIAMVFTIGLMFADYHYQYLGGLRSAFSVVVAPLQYAVDYPVRIVQWTQALVGSKKALINENMQIRYEQAILEAKMQNLLTLREENSQLKELLLTSNKANMRAMAAQILAVDTTNSRQVVVLDKGKREGVFVGQPVLDAKGVMGQVIDVGTMTSTVLLVSDAKCAIPIRNNRTGERGILVGTNNMENLSLVNLPKTSLTQKGDVLVTSGLGRRYPEGYPVGKVEEVKSPPGEAFIKVNVSPIALLNRSRLVLLLWPNNDQIALSMQINERLNALERLA